MDQPKWNLTYCLMPLRRGSHCDPMKCTSMPNPSSENPLDSLLRARLRTPEGAVKRLAALRLLMRGVDGVTRGLTGRAFFSTREAEVILAELEGRTGPEMIDTLMAMKGGTSIRARGLEHIPKTGAVIIGATHPTGAFDFLAHARALMDKRPDLKAVANREAERFLGADRIIAVDFGVKERVSNAHSTLHGMEAHVKSGGALLVFGSGKVAGMQKGHLKEPDWRSGITRISADTGTPIVPGALNVKNSKYYYRTRRTFGALSGGNDDFGRIVASLSYVTEVVDKLGGQYDVAYGAPEAPGTHAPRLQEAAERLIPGLYRA